MAIESDSVLVISDGGVPGLVCCLLALNPETVVVWTPPAESACPDHPAAAFGPANRSAVERQADLLGLRGVEAGAIGSWGHGATSLPTSAMLLLATQDAVRLGCAEVIWPVVCGSDLDELATAVERARLISRLTMLPPQQGRARSETTSLVRVRTPLADLTAVQVAELALDLDAPINTCWWQEARSSKGGQAEGAESLSAWLGETRLLWEGALKQAAANRGHSLPQKLAEAG